MLAEIGPFQALLDAIGWLLAWVYDLVGSFGIAIIVLTIVFRLLLLPLGIKQIKAMQATQALQPKVKEIQRKYKGNRQKIQEQQMKLYQEYGVSPFGGCLPVLLQFPILIAMYSVIRAPVPNAPADRPPAFKDNHLPVDSALFLDVTSYEEDRGQEFLLMNLQCSPQQAGRTVAVRYSNGEPSPHQLDCGSSIPDRIPYYVLLALMIGATYYSMRQTQKATPASAQNQQTMLISRIMPLTFGIFGFSVPAGLVLYWTVSSLFQIGQQAVMLRMGHIGPEALDRRLDEARAKAAAKGGRRTGFLGQMMERAEQERSRRSPDASPTPRKPPPRTPRKGSSGGGSKGTNRSSGGGPRRPNGSGRNRPKGRGR